MGRSATYDFVTKKDIVWKLPRLNIFDGLQLDSLEIPRLRRDPNAWKHIVIGHDSDSANILCNKYIAAELDIFPRLLPIFQPCFSHIVSGSVQNSHPEIDFSDLSKVAHLLNKKDFIKIKDRCRVLFSEAEIALPLSSFDASKDLWDPFLDKVLSANGPFFQKDRAGRRAGIVRRFAEYFSLGLPRPHQNWEISAVCTFDLVRSLLVEVFDRNTPIPIITRWHTIQMAAWRMLGLISFRLIRQLCGDCYIVYMPGDPVDPNVLDNEGDINLRSGRMGRIHSYIRKGDFANAVVTLSVDSIPRWPLSRRIESERNPEDEDN